MSTTNEPCEIKKRSIEHDDINTHLKKSKIEDVSINRTNLKISNKPFKSPEAKPSKANHVDQLDVHEDQIEAIRQKISKIDDEIKEMNVNYNEKDLDAIIDQLHLYNDVKDMSQFLLEKMANIKGVTIKSMHQTYGLNIDSD